MPTMFIENNETSFPRMRLRGNDKLVCSRLVGSDMVTGRRKIT